MNGAAGRPTVAIVDPFSTGSQLAPEFSRRGWDAVAVLSGNSAPDHFIRGFRSADYLAVIDAARTDVVTALRAHSPAYVISGSEWGVGAADRLAKTLGLPGNGTELSASRRDKFAMVQRIKAAGLRTAASVETDRVDEILKWADDGPYWPIVIKPLASAGSDSVLFCDGEEDVRKAFAQIYGQTNKMGGYNASVLAQEKLLGEQYFVNTVSRDGRHYVHEIWREKRVTVDGRILYDRQELLPSGGAHQQALADYTTGVLDALGISYGPAHTELMLTAEGPVLIETGARLEGSVTSAGPHAATGTSQVALTVDAYTDPERFAALPGGRYPLHRRLWVVCMISPRAGRIATGPLDRLRSLPTYLCGSVDHLQPGAAVEETVDLFTSPGHLYLVGDSLAEIVRDYERVRELERAGLYDGG